MSGGILQHIEPKSVFYYFEELSNIPRESGNEQAVSEFLLHFARQYGFEAVRDEALNVLIRKRASPSCAHKPGIILQAHMDMVCEKNRGVAHDFTHDPIRMEIDGDRIIARETTLGADNGIGLALALALLADKDAEHPDMELLCTSDEEMGMSGVEKFDASILTGRILINLDANDEGVFVVGCAGGPVVQVHMPVAWEPAEGQLEAVRLSVSGLLGGHSGEDIHRGRANANKLIGRVLGRLAEGMPLRLAALSGGLKYNAIPREAEAVLLLRPEDRPSALAIVEEFKRISKKEYGDSDAGISIRLEPFEGQTDKILCPDSTKSVLAFISLAASGIVRMSPEFPDIVESSISLGVVRLEERQAVFFSMIRSSVKSMYLDLYYNLAQLAALLGATTTVQSNCPEWEFNPESRLKQVFASVHRDMFGTEPKFMVLHAGLECGVLKKKIPEQMDMIAAGPDIRNLHAPGEYVSISSTARFWRFLKEVVRHIG